ncbi:hypothetical protein BCR34DRAFT_586162 [Clohesyomyces aquaticus]|uniref:Uncharacterized protein n=1 Tax=Clohesyomyces aquaticus TaxID=1231657 RepID=A0A1Y1ZUK2_9PLEO|nr:hypothetical protein BCR34DRAFT_586162 [Clohesyomyces aquaticus]
MLHPLSMRSTIRSKAELLTASLWRRRGRWLLPRVRGHASLGQGGDFYLICDTLTTPLITRPPQFSECVNPSDNSRGQVWLGADDESPPTDERPFETSPPRRGKTSTRPGGSRAWHLRSGQVPTAIAVDASSELVISRKNRPEATALRKRLPYSWRILSRVVMFVVEMIDIVVQSAVHLYHQRRLDPTFRHDVDVSSSYSRLATTITVVIASFLWDDTLVVVVGTGFRIPSYHHQIPKASIRMSGTSLKSCRSKNERAAGNTTSPQPHRPDLQDELFQSYLYDWYLQSSPSVVDYLRRGFSNDIVHADLFCFFSRAFFYRSESSSEDEKEKKVPRSDHDDSKERKKDEIRRFPSKITVTQAEAAGGGPANFGKVKDKKALADPLGVDPTVTFDAIRSSLKYFLKGFHDVVPVELISIFSEEGQELLVSDRRGKDGYEAHDEASETLNAIGSRNPAILARFRFSKHFLRSRGFSSSSDKPSAALGRERSLCGCRRSVISSGKQRFHDGSNSDYRRGDPMTPYERYLEWKLGVKVRDNEEEKPYGITSGRPQGIIGIKRPFLMVKQLTGVKKDRMEPRKEKSGMGLRKRMARSTQQIKEKSPGDTK